MPRPSILIAAALTAFGLVAYHFRPPGASWPRLATAHYTAGRVATPADIRNGSAAFVLEQHGQPNSRPAAIQIPQYAWVFDREFSSWRPTIVIQAEQDPRGCTWYGVRDLPDERSGGLAIPDHIILLGTDRPSRWLPYPPSHAVTTPPECIPPAPPTWNVIVAF